MSGSYTKSRVSVIQTATLREMVETINRVNAEAPTILKNDIVTLTRENDSWILVYYM